jgi:hypothetical protein
MEDYVGVGQQRFDGAGAQVAGAEDEAGVVAEVGEIEVGASVGVGVAPIEADHVDALGEQRLASAWASSGQ